MLSGRTVAPFTGQRAGLGISLDDLIESGVVEVPGAATDLAASISTQGITAAWLRLEPTDRDVQLQRRLVERAVTEHRAPQPPELLIIDDAYRTLDRHARAAIRNTPTVVLTRPPARNTALEPELVSLTSAERDALLLTARLGYAHPDLASVAEAARDLPRWRVALEPLSDGWVRVRPSRRSALEQRLRVGPPVERARFHQLIAALMTRGAAIEAVELCLASNAPGCAADLLDQSGEDLIDQGFSATVQGWLERLEDWDAPARPDRLRSRLFPAVRPWSRLLARRPAAPANHNRRPTQLPGNEGKAPAARTSDREPKPTDPPPATAAERSAPDGGVAPARRGLHVRLLGELSAEIDGVAVTHWSGHRGRSVFRYLVAYRHHVVPRDVLVDVFWPDSTPELGRNRLHVTLHALRADLRTASERPVIVHRDGGFQLNPELDVWVDREAFEQLLAEGSAAERIGDASKAQHTYQQALALYRGDFLEDSPYEEWAVLERETLRIGHLDLLDRLGHLSLAAADYGVSADAGRRILAIDCCNERAHRLLMRCFARQDQPHLAARQFQLCERVLRQEMAIEPDEATVELSRRLQARQPI